MKRTVSITFFVLVLVGFFLANPTFAAKIIWVSGNLQDEGGVDWDQGFVDMLEAAGHEVQRENDTIIGKPLTPEQVAVLESGDLVIVSRSTNSGTYNSTSWNTVAKPLISTTSYLSRDNRWKWLNNSDILGGGDSGAPLYRIEYTDHPIFAGIEPDENGNIAVLDGTVGSGNTSLPDCQDFGNGALLASVADTGTVAIAYWGYKTQFHAATEEVAAAPRMLFNCGTRENASETNQGIYNLTPVGAQLFLNAVDFMLAQQPPLTSYMEDFDAAVDVDFWRPNKAEHDDGTPIFDVSQEDGALKVVMNQANFPDGQMYDFLQDNITFNLTHFPMWAMKIKVEPGATYTQDGNVTDIDAVPFMGSPFSKNGPTQTRQHSNPTVNVPDDGEWHDVVFDWRTPDADQTTNPNVYTNITRLLLEVVKWPGTHQATFWIDDFKVGLEAVPEDERPLPVVMASHPPAIDGDMDPIWKHTPWVRDFIYPSGATIFRDAALSWRAMWDYDYLYLYIRVVDDVFKAETQITWHGDSVELWLDGDNSKQTAYDGINDLGYGFLYTDDPNNPLIFHPGDEWRMGTAGHLQGAAYWEGGVDLELAIPMANLGVSAPMPGHLMGMDVDWNDNDEEGGDRDTKCKWFDATDNSWDNPSLMGTIQLVDRVVYDYTDVWYTSTPVAIDGVPDDLSAYPVFPLNQYMASVDKMDNWLEDVAMDYQVVWDDNYLYYSIHVADDTLIQDGAYDHTDDGLELWLDGDNSRKTAYDGINDIGVGFKLEPGTGLSVKDVYTWNAGFAAFDPATLLSASSETEDGVFLEFAIPLDSVQIKPMNGYMFAHDIDYNDDDDSGDRDTKAKVFPPVDETWQNPSYMNPAKLMGGPGEELPEEIVGLCIDKTAVPPVIDGTMEPLWDTARNYHIGIMQGPTSDGWWDSYGYYRIVYDDDNLYMFVTVHDDVLDVHLTDDYKKDSIELFFDGDNSKNTLDEGEDPWAWPPVNYDDNDDQFRFVYSGVGQNGSLMGRYDTSNAEFVTVETDKGWNLELAMPLAGQPMEAEPGSIIGFEIAINDADGGEDRENVQMWWGETGEAWHDPSVLGTAMFTDRTINEEELGRVLPIPFMPYPITVDAEMDFGWNDVAEVFGNHRMNTPDSMSTPNDAEMSWKVAWNYDYLYFWINVVDDVLLFENSTSTWADDGIEFWFDGNGDQTASWDGVYDQFLKCNFSEETVLTPIVWGGRNPSPELDSTQLASIMQAKKLTDKGLVMEIAFPLDVLNIAPGEGTKMALDLDWNDSDTPDEQAGANFRDTKIKAFDPTDGVWGDSRLMGLARFVGSKLESEVESDIEAVVTEYELSQNYPNPFNPSTTIEFAIPQADKVKLTIYDILGRQVAVLVDERMEAGRHAVSFDARRFASGVYLYSLQTSEQTMNKKMMFIK
ncbi:T9SS C-terminal target domain-containing protein [candidate division KSB1 bacterium]|nr:T9SS type A sorting domain-containing protein [candidate division KSB1 bacterium]RQW05199.1 MAG: T9SS C-terminal target domain-containing protein [candidate division KSB1 bacterium]